MRLLLDENFPRSGVASLAAGGHDVLAIAEASPEASDRAVLALARSENRCLVTFDADFGDLIFNRGELAPPAIVFLRLHPIVVADVVALVLQALRTQPDGHFVVVTRESMRRRRFPDVDADGGG